MKRPYVWPVDLDEVAGRIPKVELHAPAGQLIQVMAEGLDVACVELLRFRVDRLKVLDGNSEVTMAWRGLIALEQMKLKFTKPQPLLLPP